MKSKAIELAVLKEETDISGFFFFNKAIYWGLMF
jgi:hypothetical protein